MDENQNSRRLDNNQLSPQELAKAKALQAEIRRKLSILFADPSTPESFKSALNSTREE